MAVMQSLSANVAALDVDRIYKRFGPAEVVRGVTIGVQPGTILSLLGPSGCGKTTILRMIAGLLEPTSGAIRFNGEDVTRIPPHRRRVGMVFQNYALFPHMTAAENVAFGLKMQGVPRAESRAMVDGALAMVQMAGMAGRYPGELSGGQQQRISLARAIVTRPRILLLDEPFGALDRKLREEMQIEVKQLQRELGLTFVFVTHDQEEALTLSDTIAVMRGGAIEQLGTPADVFDRPRTHFVAEFFGTLNTLPVNVLRTQDAMSLVEAACGNWLVGGRHDPGTQALFAVRSNDTCVRRDQPAEAGMSSLSGTLEDAIYKGSTVVCRVRLSDGSKFTATAEPEEAAKLTPGANVVLSWPACKSFLFPVSHAQARAGQ